MHKSLLPEGWLEPKGYANGVVASGEVIYLGGQIGWNSQREFETDDFVEQFRQTLINIKDVLEAGGASPENMVRMTWFITDKKAYNENLREIGRVYRQILGRNFPAMSVVQVVALMEDRAKVEIEVTAVKP